jgi:hypothetical protein
MGSPGEQETRDIGLRKTTAFLTETQRITEARRKYKKPIEDKKKIHLSTKPE